MAGETVITVVGNLTADPELRYTQNGLPVANFTIASTPRNFDRQANEWKDGEALFLRASVWREFAEHVAGCRDDFAESLPDDRRDTFNPIRIEGAGIGWVGGGGGAGRLSPG